ncbi:alcohol acetyltransferase [Scheffersomyces xylosifermentans]|uniref:alcohol acetyltransferase n=1 Tax=Scheffersomyces xylosifermentans TaxID=1304137 RepID=UPI00315DDF97
MIYEPVITRPLSLYEHFFRSRTASSFYRNFQLTATYSQDLDKDLGILFKALRKAVLDYHILVCNVFKDYDLEDSVFRPLQKVALSDLLQFKDPKVYLNEDGVINEKFMKEVTELQFPLYTESPLFRLFLVGSNNLSVVFEHTIADGLVSNYFHEIFLESLAYVQKEQNDSNLLTEYGIQKSHISLESIVFDFNSDKKFIRNSLPPPPDIFLAAPEVDSCDGNPNHYSKVIPENYTKKWPGRNPLTKDYSLAFKLINFTPLETKEILAKCKEEKVTLTAFIEVVHALTMKPVFGDSHYSSHRVAIALRRHYDHNLAEPEYKEILQRKGYKILGCSAHLGFTENFPPLTEFSWEIVRKINANLIESSANKKVLDFLRPFKQVYSKVDDNVDFFESSMKSGVKSDAVKISNLGFINAPIFKIDGKDPLTITNMVFSQDVSPNTCEFMLNIISTPLGGLNFVETYMDHTFDDFESDNFDQLIANLRTNVLKYSGRL